MTATVLSLQGVTKRYSMGDDTILALRGVDLHVAKGEFVAITGSSGSGKSTLLNIVGCLDRPSSGNYMLNGQDVANMGEDALAEVRNREIGFVFQSFHLLPRATALQNVMQPLCYRRMRQGERIERATHALRRVGLDTRARHIPNQLSGGQRQRVAIARALCGGPSIVLADEPTGNLDSVTTLDIMALFRQLHDEGHTVVMITHEPDIAAQCGRVIRMADGAIASDEGNASHARVA